MNKRPSLKINAISNWMSLSVQVAIGFFLTPFIISHLGKTGYGIWTLVGSFIGYYGLLNLGVGSAITRYIARYSAQKDTKGLNETANTALVMFCITGILAIMISFFVAEPLAKFFEVEPDQFYEFKHIVWVLGISTGLSFPSGVFSAMITARERFVAVNVINITSALLRSCLTVIILLSGYGLVGIAYPALAATLVSLVAFIVLSKRIVPEFRVKLGAANLRTLKVLLIYGSFTTILAITDILRFSIDSIVIGRMVGIAEVGVYGVAALLVRYMLQLIISGMNVATPRFAALDGSEKQAELKDLFFRSLSVASFMACGVALMLIIFGRSFIFLWVGSDFAAAVPVLWVLAVAWALDLAQNPGIGLMYALNKHRNYATVTMVEAIANFLISVCLAPRYGIVGVAMGTAIPMAIVKIFVQPIYVSRIAQCRIGDYMKAMLPAFFVSGIMITMYQCIYSLVEINFYINSYFYLILLIGALGVVYYGGNLLLSPTIRRLTFMLIPSLAVK